MKNPKEFYFSVGQRVRMFDKDDNANVYGHVLEVKANEVLELSSIVVKWNDLNDPCEHYYDEFKNIKNGIPE